MVFFFTFMVLACMLFMDLAMGLIFEAFMEAASTHSSSSEAKEMKSLAKVQYPLFFALELSEGRKKAPTHADVSCLFRRLKY
jgi:hypothetical protein